MRASPPGLRNVPIILFALLLAGCAGDSGGKVGISASSAPPPEVSADTGAIAGAVMDDELRPVEHAEVLVGGRNMTPVRSDAKGAFTINDLEPGTHTLLIGRIGFLAATKRVDVTAGETTTVQITLEPIAVVEPRVENFVDNGHVTLSIVVPSVYFNSQSTLGPYKVLFYQNATQGAVGIVSTGVWDRSTPLTASRMGLTVAVTGEASNTSAGKEKVTARLLDLNVEGRQRFSIRFDTVHVCTNGTSCIEDPPNRVAQVVYDQKTTVYTAVFYTNPPPDGFIAAPT